MFKTLFLVILLCISNITNTQVMQRGSACKCEKTYDFVFFDIDIYSSWSTYDGNCCGSNIDNGIGWITIGKDVINTGVNRFCCASEGGGTGTLATDYF